MDEPTGSRKTIAVAGLGLAVLGILLGFVGVIPIQLALTMAGTAAVLLALQVMAAVRETEQAQQQALMTRRVFAASESILSSLDVGHVLQSAAEAAADLSWHAGACLLFVVDDTQHLVLRSSSGVDPHPPEHTRFPALDSYLAEVHKTRRPSITSLPSGSGALEPFQSACFLPLQHKGGIVGELVLLSAKPPGAFKQEMNVLDYYANQVAIAIDNARLYHRVQDLFLSTIKALAAAVDAKDAYTHGHSEDIAALVGMIAREMHLPPHEQEKAKLAGLLHDVGKIGIPDAILRKPGRLDASERAIMMTHARLGAEIIDKPGPLQDLVAIVRHHHEWHDGRGYPDGLRGSAIPIGAAILAVADAFDAMTSHRAYHAARPTRDALDELQHHAGTQFNPEVVSALVRVIERERAGRSDWYRALEGRIRDHSQGQEPAPAVEQAATTEAGAAIHVAQELRNIADLRTLLDRLTEITPPALGIDACAVLLIDDRGQELAVEAGGGGGAIQRGQTIARGRSQAWRAIEQHAAQIDAEGRTVHAPLIAGGRAIGVLAASGIALGTDHMRRVSMVADAVAPIIQTARLNKRSNVEDSRDSLTGLLNRPAMISRLKEEGNRYHRQGTPYTLALVSVHDLPQFNATYGFGAGDELIKRIASILADHTRMSDVVGRISGGTFAILMPGDADPDATRGVQRLGSLFADRQVPVKGQFVTCPALSWVIASCPKDAKEPDALFAQAERRLIARQGG